MMVGCYTFGFLRMKDGWTTVDLRKGEYPAWIPVDKAAGHDLQRERSLGPPIHKIASERTKKPRRSICKAALPPDA